MAIPISFVRLRFNQRPPRARRLLFLGVSALGVMSHQAHDVRLIPILVQRILHRYGKPMMMGSSLMQGGSNRLPSRRFSQPMP